MPTQTTSETRNQKYSNAAKKAWMTRRKNERAKKDRNAALKAWETRRRNNEANKSHH